MKGKSHLKIIYFAVNDSFKNSHTSILMSVSTLGPGRKELMNQGDFQAEGDSILLLKGVSPNLQEK